MPRLSLLCVALLSVAHTSVARPYRPNVLFDLDLGDTSTMFTYFPDNWRPNPEPGNSWWATTFDEAPDTYVPGMVGPGRAAHYAVAPESRPRVVVERATLSFVGRGVTVRGKQNSSWSPDFTLGSSADPALDAPIGWYINYDRQPVGRYADDTLFRTDNMSFAYNSIMMEPNRGLLALTTTTVMTGMVAEA